jgi:mono/diheme cytochrome c family protein
VTFRGRRGLAGAAGRFALGALAALFAAAAGAPPAAAQQRSSSEELRLFPAKTEGDETAEKRRWIEKTARLLRGGEGLGPDDDLDALMKLPEDAIARHFMRDPRFGDTVLDFNLFVLGFKPDRLKAAGAYEHAAFDFPNAVASAQALLAGGDYLRLFDLEGPLYLAPLSLQLEDAPAGEDAGLTPPQLRMKAMAEMRAAFAAVIARGRGPRPNGDVYCDEVGDFLGRREAMSNRFIRAFNDAEIFVITRTQLIDAPFAAAARIHGQECDGQPEQWVEIDLLAGALEGALAQLERGFAEILKHEPDRYRPRSVAEFRTFDLAALADSRPWLAFGHEQSTALANSSTNFNRKRAAYVLKRFFCDDIVAAPPEAPPQHGKAEAENTCIACHAKLDPMAGFFRGRGANFFDYGRMNAIVFDDLSTADRAAYEAAWRAPAGAGREWNVGYIRSASSPGGNVYGSTLADLSRIIRTAPEAKRCLVMRLFEYMVAPGQMIDPGWLDHLAQTFEREAAVSASEAFRNAILRIAQSRAYRARDLAPRQCYDHAPGANPEESPPCRIAHVLKRNCTGCHDSAQDGDGNLDLGRWIASPDGRGRTFPHLDRFLDQVAPEETLSKLVERLATRDPKQRMPKNRLMRADERDELMQWAQQELARIRQRGGR